GARPATGTGHPVLTRQALEDWVADEKRRVTAHLGQVLRPDVGVLGPLTDLDPVLTLASVSSSAMSRLDACLTATGLAPLFPGPRRYSAEDSLPVPVSKPDPAIYLLAGQRLGCSGRQALAVEDSVPGARAAPAGGAVTGRAVVHSQNGGPEVLRVVDRPVREPGPGEVRVRVHRAGVNPTDWKSRQGDGSGRPVDPPQVPGQDGAGVVDAV